MEVDVKKIVIDWELAEEFEPPCYFWNGKRPEKPIVGRLIQYDTDKATGEANRFETCSYGAFEHCELILDSDKEKYSKVVWEGRDNFIKALKEKKPMKVRVTPELSKELQEISFENDFDWVREGKTVAHLKFDYLIFSNRAILCGFTDVGFHNVKGKEYYPETDSFTAPEPEYRACENLDEFRPFLGKIARDHTDESEEVVVRSSPYAWRHCFKNHELLEPINGSKTIGVKK